MPLGTEFNLGPGDVVLDGVQLLKGAQPPRFGSCLLWPHGWMDEDTTWYGSRPLPRPRCIGRGPSSPRKGHSSLPLFSAHVYYGHGRPSTAELLFTCCISALPDFSQLLFDFFNIFDSRLIFPLLYDSLNLVINAFSLRLLEFTVQEKSQERCSSWTVLHLQSTSALSSGFALWQGNAEGEVGKQSIV